MKTRGHDAQGTRTVKILTETGLAERRAAHIEKN